MRNKIVQWLKMLMEYVANEGRADKIGDSGLRFYGDGNTLHHSTYLDVEVYEGRVVSVWFRCQNLPFRQTDVEKGRAGEMIRMYGREAGLELHGVEVWDK